MAFNELIFNLPYLKALPKTPLLFHGVSAVFHREIVLYAELTSNK